MKTIIPALMIPLAACNGDKPPGDSPMSSMYTDHADLYDLIYSAKDYAAEAQRLHALLASLGVPDGARLLDAACGTGRHLAELGRWYQTLGFDQSEAMLRIARRRVEAPLWRADLQDFTLAEPVDAATCLFSAIGYLTDEAALRRAADCFAAAIRPGGALLVEPWLTLERWDTGRPFAQSANSPELSVARVNVAEREGELAVMNMRWFVVPRGGPITRFEEHHRMWLCPHATLCAAFDEAGFTCHIDEDGLMKDRGLLVGIRR